LGKAMTAENPDSTTGAQFEISIDGVPRTYRDRKDLALLAAQILKSKIPNSVVRLKTCRWGKRSSSRSKNMTLTMRPTGLGTGIDKDRPDYTVYSGEWAVGRIYETRGGPIICAGFGP
jgi:hypothetical protein